jgi:hypothetical protein
LSISGEVEYSIPVTATTIGTKTHATSFSSKIVVTIAHAATHVPVIVDGIEYDFVGLCRTVGWK